MCLRFLTWSLRNLCYDSDHNTPIISSQTNIAYKREKYFLPVWEAGQLVAQHAQSPWVTFNSVGPWHMPVMAVLMRWRQVFLSYMVNSRPAWLLESLSPKKLIQKDMTSPSPPTAQKGNKEFPCSADRPGLGGHHALFMLFLTMGIPLQNWVENRDANRMPAVLSLEELFQEHQAHLISLLTNNCQAAHCAMLLHQTTTHE